MKYNVLFVEDEYMVREHIRHSSIWQEYDFSLVGEAANGEDALALLIAHPVDILLTDIRMPFMDGLELAAVVRQRWPQIHIIILSGYNDFTYAQRALRLGVSEYLMKPFKAADLLQVLCAEAKKIEAAQSALVSSRKLYLQKFLNQLASGVLSEAMIRQRAQEWDLRLFRPCYVAGIAYINFGLPRSSQEEAMNTFDIMSAADGLLQNRKDAFAFSRSGADVHFFLCGDTGEQLVADAKTFAQRLQEALLTCDGIDSCVIALGRPFTALGALGESLSEVQFALTMRPLPDRNAMIDVSTLNSNAALQTVEIRSSESLLRNLLFYGTTADIPAFIRRLEENYRQCSALMFVYAGLDILTTVLQVLHELGLDNETLHMDQYLLEFGQCTNVHDVSHFFDLLSRLLHDALSIRTSQRGKKYVAVIAQAQQYIREHFQSAELSLTEVAHHVNISSAYFSSLFRQETGESFVEFLTLVRIEEAKRLLSDPARRTTEISFDVGFTDPNYFSKLFKKATGLSPREFRSGLGRAE